MLRLKLILTVFSAVMLACFNPQIARSGPTLVFDAQTGTVLHSEEAGNPWYPASLTKLMTAYVVFRAIDEGKLSLESKFDYSANAQAEPPSKIGLPVGTKFSIDWGLQALLVRSSNDIAVALAEAVGGTEGNFVRMMNENAKRLAMTGSYFSNPHGLPDRRNITTARDMGLLAQAIIREFPQYQRYFDAPNVRHGKRRLRNRNHGFLKLSKAADGMKTGFICSSGFNVVATATKEGRRLVAVVFGSKSSAARSKRAHRLIEKAFTKQAGGLLSVPRKILELTNGGLLARYPTDMAKKICRNSGTVRVTRGQAVRGWSVVLGRDKNAVDAQKQLDANLEALRDVVYGGRAAVVRVPGEGHYAAMIYALGSNQTSKACAVLKPAGKSCEIQGPDVYKEVLARLAAEAKAKAAAKKAARKKAARKKAARKKAARKKAATKPRKKRNKTTAKRKKKPTTQAQETGSGSLSLR